MATAHEHVQRSIATVNQHDQQSWGALYATDAVVHDPIYPKPLTGRGAIEQDLADFFRAFPDLRLEAVRDVCENGATVAAEFTMSGTHDGPLAGPDGDIAATGQPVQIRMAAFARLNGAGEVVEEHRYYDLAGLMGQLGLTP